MHQCVGYASSWQPAGGGFSAHLTTYSEQDLQLWAPPCLADRHRTSPQWLRLQGVLVGTWLIVTAIAPAKTSGPS